jgi:transcriptional regulator with XRE-family HTH domain
MGAELVTDDPQAKAAGLPGLRAIREAKLLTQEELAVLAGVNAATISGLEGGKRVARFRTIRQLAAALEVEPARLLRSPSRRTRRERLGAATTLTGHGGSEEEER